MNRQEIAKLEVGEIVLADTHGDGHVVPATVEKNIHGVVTVLIEFADGRRSYRRARPHRTFRLDEPRQKLIV
jgi:hypothetical protein